MRRMVTLLPLIIAAVSLAATLPLARKVAAQIVFSDLESPRVGETIQLEFDTEGIKEIYLVVATETTEQASYCCPDPTQVEQGWDSVEVSDQPLALPTENVTYPRGCSIRQLKPSS